MSSSGSTSSSYDSIDWTLMINEDTILVFINALAVVAYAAHRALGFDHLFDKGNDLQELSIASGVALAIPVVGSISLVLFFYFFSFISQLSLFVACITSSIGISLVLAPIFEKVFESKEVKIPCSEEKVPLVYVILYPISVSIVLVWLFTGHWMLNNVLGIAISIMAICFVRVPSIRIAAMVLGGLFVYDIFWVFFSEYFFGESVMVAVATKQAENPVVNVAKTLHIPDEVVSKQIHLPMKLIWGGIMLGLGDIVVPGFLVAYALRFDRHNKSKDADLQIEDEEPKKEWTYFSISLIGYAVGILLSMITSFVWNTAQPALLYIVPSTLFPVMLLGLKRKEFLSIWNGFEQPQSKVDEAKAS